MRFNATFIGLTNPTLSLTQGTHEAEMCCGFELSDVQSRAFTFWKRKLKELAERISFLADVVSDVIVLSALLEYGGTVAMLSLAAVFVPFALMGAMLARVVAFRMELTTGWRYGFMAVAGIIASEMQPHAVCL